jgi:hypothetical protein
MLTTKNHATITTQPVTYFTVWPAHTIYFEDLV